MLTQKVDAMAIAKAWWTAVTMFGIKGATKDRNASGTLARIFAPRSPVPVRLRAWPLPPPAENWLTYCAGMPFAIRRPGSSFVNESARSVPAIVSPMVPLIC